MTFYSFCSLKKSYYLKSSITSDAVPGTGSELEISKSEKNMVHTLENPRKLVQTLYNVLIISIHIVAQKSFYQKLWLLSKRLSLSVTLESGEHPANNDII